MRKNKLEIEEGKSRMAREAFKRGSINKKNPLKVLNDIVGGKIQINDLPSGSIFRFAFSVNGKTINLNLFASLLKNKCTDLLEDKEYALVICEISNHEKEWIRDPKDWTRKSYNIKKQFEDLLKFLFCKYPTPTFLNNVWLEPNLNNAIRQKKWYLNIVKGGSIKDCKRLPVKLTNRMAHEFMQAPSDYSFYDAFIWAKVKCMGGDERLVQTINGTLIRRNIDTYNHQTSDVDVINEYHDKEQFWDTVIKFFADNKMISPEKISPIVDYINHIKFNRRRERINGILRLMDAESPNFTMKGKNAESLLEKTEKWHDELNKENKTKNTVQNKWQPFEIEDFSYEEGSEKNRRRYIITQLINREELSREGKAMRHCVSSYAGSCSSGRCSIWSLRMYDNGGNCHRMVTIELLREKSIVQIRGKFNRTVDAKEMFLINKWAVKENLIISKWC